MEELQLKITPELFEKSFYYIDILRFISEDKLVGLQFNPKTPHTFDLL